MFNHLLEKIKNRIIHVSQINLIKTIYLNFRILPFSQAFRLPILIYGSIKLHGLTGKIIINCPIRTGLLRLGKITEMIMTEAGAAQLTIKGTLVVKGEDIVTGPSCQLIIEEKGYLEIGEHSFFGRKTKVIVTDRVILGKFFRMPFESQLMDTNFHYVIDIATRKVNKLFGSSIEIGDYVWIGNRSSIMKGTALPSKCMVTSNSLLNKDFRNLGEYAIIGGIPAKFIKYGKSRIYNAATERFLHEYFVHNLSATSIILPDEYEIFE